MSHIITEDDLDKLIKEHEKHSGKLKSALGGDNCWDAGLEIVKECGSYDGGQYTIVFSPLSDEKIKILMRTFPSLEWLGYLVGQVDHTHRYVYVEDFVLPKQRVSYGAVDNVEYGWNEGLPIIGVIHSHHGMGAFFSGTDDAYINQNHDVSIVVATRPGREIKAQIRIKTKCGKYYINEDVRFAVNAPVILDVSKFMDIIQKNISYPVTNRPTYASTQVRPQRFIPNQSKGNFGTFEGRIGFVPFDALDEDFNDGTEVDDEEDDELLYDDDGAPIDFTSAVMEDIKRRDISELGTPVVQPDAWNTEKVRSVSIPIEQGEGDNIFQPWQTPTVNSVVDAFKEAVRKQKLGWLYTPPTK